MKLSTSDILEIVRDIGKVIEDNKQYLTELDAAIGDADHGINMARGFRAVSQKLEGMRSEDIGEILKAVGMTLVSNVGGASGPLYGTAFIRAASAVQGKSSAGLDDFVSMLDAAIEGIKSRGKAELEDKTMLDALIPAVAALREAEAEGMSLVAAFARAKEAANTGLLHTKDIVARKGRASYLGERSFGHQDPGATSSYLMLASIHESLQELRR